MRSATLLKIGASLLLLGSAMAPPVLAADFTDDFSGTTLKPEWKQTIPKDGPTFTVNNGLTIALDAQAYDEWAIPNDFAPRLEMAPPAGDFTMTGKLAGVTDTGGAPIEDQNYHATLFVSFGPFDKFMFGLYRHNNDIRVERSNVGILGADSAVTDATTTPVSLQIIRTGNNYHFLYRQNDADPWSELKDSSGKPYSIYEAKPVENVGIMQKTWSAIELNAKWNSFSLVSGQTFYPTIRGKITSTGGSPSKIIVQVLDASNKVVDQANPNADGTYAVAVEPTAATYSVRLAGSDLFSSQSSSVQSGVNVPAGTAGVSNVDIGGVQIAPDLNAATDQKLATNFPGPTLDPNFSLNEPKAGATVTSNNGLHIDIPAQNAFDYWSTIDESPKLRIPAPPGDFITSIKLGGTDPDGNPLVGNFNIYLGVNFAPKDGFVSTLALNDTTLEVLRWGGAEDQQLQITGSPVWVQIRKTGDVYSFYYKLSADGAWVPFALTEGAPAKNISDTRKPLFIEFGVKTWDPNVSPAVNGLFSDFNLEAAKIVKNSSVSGKVTTNGPDPSKASVAFSVADGTITAILPIAADGTFSGVVPEGSYTATVMGNIVQPNQAAASQSVNLVAGQANTVNFTGVQYYPNLDPASDKTVEDKFNGPALDPVWTKEIPAPGATIDAASGLTFTLPGTRAFDYWVTVNDSPRIVQANPPGDFIMTGKLDGVNDPAGDPIEGRNYHSALYVYFGGNDAIFWGAYRSNTAIRLERSGTGFDPNIALTGNPAYLQIRRVGNTYSFYTKAQDDTDWTQEVNGNGDPITITEPRPALKVGIVQKTWENLGLVSKWSDFTLETANVATPTGCKGDANSDRAVDVNDAVAILRHIVGIGDPLSGQNLTNANVNGDAGVDVNDAVGVLQAIVGIDNGLGIKLTCG